MRKSLAKIIFLTVALAALMSAGTAFSQVRQGDQLDKILAIVGKEIIMKSDVDGRISLLVQQTPALTEKATDPSFRDLVLNSLIDEKLVISKAVEDSVLATDEEIDQRWNMYLQQVLQQFGSEKRVEQVYGMSISKIKSEIRPDIVNAIISDKIQSKYFAEIKATSREVEEFYNMYRDSLPELPASIEIYHIVKTVEANTKEKELVLDLAKKVRDSIARGGNFAEFAKKYSGDPGTAALGGDLGWMGRGRFFPEFEKAAFGLQPGELSIPVETPFGYHIIETLEKRKDQVNCRHILFKVGQTSDDREKAKKFLVDLKARAEKGESFEELAKKYSDDKDTKGFGGLIPTMFVTEIPENLKADLDKLNIGGITDPLPYGADASNPSYHIIMKKKVIAAHKISMDQDSKLIEQRATEFKKMNARKDWISQLRKSMYWEIKK